VNDKAAHWKGIGKLIEELGEVQQILGKMIAFPATPHPDNKGPLVLRLQAEITDLSAAIQYFLETNAMMVDLPRYADKLEKFKKWGLPGVVDCNARPYSDMAGTHYFSAPDGGGDVCVICRGPRTLHPVS
jgi:hypothetical protein